MNCQKEQNRFIGSSCGSVGRVVTSDTRGLRFESSRQQKLYIQHLLTVKCFEKTKMIPRMGQFEHNWFIVNLITTQCDKLECD